MQIEKLIDLVITITSEKPYGWTLDLETLELIVTGIAVAYIDTQHSYGRNGLRKCIRHALGHDKVIGGWLNHGKMQVDSCKLFTGHTLRPALSFASKNRQDGIFDIDLQIEIIL